jgi:hypothetical protein
MKSLMLTAAALSLLGGSALAKPGRAKGRPLKAKVPLFLPELSAEDDKGVVDVKFFPAVGKRPERSWLRFKLRRLTPGATYTLWVDDPSTSPDSTLLQVATTVPLVASGRGALSYRFDTKHDALPFGARLVDLGGMHVEVRDAAGTQVVLGGFLPSLPQ